MSESEDIEYTWQGWIESFQIFAKYTNGTAEIYAEHDVIFAGTNPDIVSPEDVARLGVLGWHPSEYGGFEQYV